MNSPPRERHWTPTWPVDLTTTLGVLQHGPRDPTMRASGGQVWRTTRTPEGPATVHYRRCGPDVVVRAWGPGAQMELDAVPDVLGRNDDPEGFAHDAHPVMAAAHRRFGSGWRVIRTRRVLESLVPAILEQRVTGREASAAWARLVREFGDPAPGPAAVDSDQGHPSLLVAPDGPIWARIPSWAWHQAGVDPGHARTITTAALRATALEALTTQPPAERWKQVVNWASAPGARVSQPREDHLIPLMVALGSAENEPGERSYSGEIFGGALVSNFRFGQS